MGSIMYQGASPKIMYQGLEYSGSASDVNYALTFAPIRQTDMVLVTYPDENYTWSPYNSDTKTGTSQGLNVGWQGTSFIGESLNSYINVKDAKKLRYKIITGDCYKRTNNSSETRWDLYVGIINEIMSTYVDQPTRSNVLAYNRYEVPIACFRDNENPIVGELDISNINVRSYPFICCNGWQIELQEFYIDY